MSWNGLIFVQEMSSISHKTMLNPWKAREKRREAWRRWKHTYRAKQKLALETEKRQRQERVNASITEAVSGFFIAHLLSLMVVSPPPVQRALAAWDAPPEAGYN